MRYAGSKPGYGVACYVRCAIAPGVVAMAVDVPRLSIIANFSSIILIQTLPMYERGRPTWEVHRIQVVSARLSPSFENLEMNGNVPWRFRRPFILMFLKHIHKIHET